MKKVLVGLSIALLALGAMGCNKDNGSSSAASASESLKQIEVKSAINDARASDPSTALTCKYILISGSNGSYSVSKAELKTSGSCDFASLASSASAAGSLDASKAAQVVSVVADDNLGSSAKDAFNCTAYNVATDVRKVGVQDCSNGNGVSDSVGKALTAILAGL